MLHFRFQHITQNKVRCTGTKKIQRQGARPEYPLNLVRLKKFVQVSECTGFCVDAENAAVWASASSAFSVSPLAKSCTSWYFRIFELNHVQMIITGVPGWSFYFRPSHRTLAGVVWWLSGEWRKQEQRETWSEGIYKTRISLYINISSTETSARVPRNTWIFSSWF